MTSSSSSIGRSSASPFALRAEEVPGPPTLTFCAEEEAGVVATEVGGSPRQHLLGQWEDHCGVVGRGRPGRISGEIEASEVPIAEVGVGMAVSYTHLTLPTKRIV